MTMWRWIAMVWIASLLVLALAIAFAQKDPEE